MTTDLLLPLPELALKVMNPSTLDLQPKKLLPNTKSTMQKTSLHHMD